MFSAIKFIRTSNRLAFKFYFVADIFCQKQTFVFSKVWKCKAQQRVKTWLIEHVWEEKATQLFDSREEVEEFFNFMDRDYDGNLSFEVFWCKQITTTTTRLPIVLNKRVKFWGVYGGGVDHWKTLQKHGQGEKMTLKSKLPQIWLKSQNFLEMYLKVKIAYRMVMELCHGRNFSKCATIYHRRRWGQSLCYLSKSAVAIYPKVMLLFIHYPEVLLLFIQKCCCRLSRSVVAVYPEVLLLLIQK